MKTTGFSLTKGIIVRYPRAWIGERCQVSGTNGTRIFATFYVSIGCVVNIRFHSLPLALGRSMNPGNCGSLSRGEHRTNAVTIDESSFSVMVCENPSAIRVRNRFDLSVPVTFPISASSPASCPGDAADE